MASTNVILGFWKPNGLQKYNVENVDLNDKVEVLKAQLPNNIGDSSLEKLELCYAGVILEDNKVLSSYGITSVVMIHVVEKKLSKPHETDKVITESEVQELVSNVRNFKLSPVFRSTLHRLQNAEEIDKVIAAVPGLEDDPVAIVMISQADLILQMEDPKIVRKLAAAIANATNTAFDSTSAGIPTTPNSSFITNEMFSSAIQHAFASGGSGASSAAPVAFSPTAAVSPAAGEESLDTITRRLQPQLQQMREMGLVNDSVNVRALQATGGDVQAAIDLVFNGIID